MNGGYDKRESKRGNYLRYNIIGCLGFGGFWSWEVLSFCQREVGHRSFFVVFSPPPHIRVFYDVVFMKQQNNNNYLEVWFFSHPCSKSHLFWIGKAICFGSVKLGRYTMNPKCPPVAGTLFSLLFVRSDLFAIFISSLHLERHRYYLP